LDIYGFIVNVVFTRQLAEKAVQRRRDGETFRASLCRTGCVNDALQKASRAERSARAFGSLLPGFIRRAA